MKVLLHSFLSGGLHSLQAAQCLLPAKGVTVVGGPVHSSEEPCLVCVGPQVTHSRGVWDSRAFWRRATADTLLMGHMAQLTPHSIPPSPSSTSSSPRWPPSSLTTTFTWVGTRSASHVGELCSLYSQILMFQQTPPLPPEKYIIKQT